MASERKGIRTEEYDCCRRTREQVRETIRLNYRSFPVIQNIVCRTCSMVLNIRVYTREELEQA